jgi:ferritin
MWQNNIKKSFYLIKGILDKIKLIGTEGQGIFFIDREIGNMAANPTKETTAMTQVD